MRSPPSQATTLSRPEPYDDDDEHTHSLLTARGHGGVRALPVQRRLESENARPGVCPAKKASFFRPERPPPHYRQFPIDHHRGAFRSPTISCSRSRSPTAPTTITTYLAALAAHAQQKPHAAFLSPMRTSSDLSAAPPFFSFLFFCDFTWKYFFHNFFYLENLGKVENEIYRLSADGHRKREASLEADTIRAHILG